jgi:hypothetical protein
MGGLERARIVEGAQGTQRRVRLWQVSTPPAQVGQHRLDHRAGLQQTRCGLAAARAKAGSTGTMSSMSLNSVSA